MAHNGRSCSWACLQKGLLITFLKTRPRTRPAVVRQGQHTNKIRSRACLQKDLSLFSTLGAIDKREPDLVSHLFHIRGASTIRFSNSFLLLYRISRSTTPTYRHQILPDWTGYLQVTAKLDTSEDRTHYASGAPLDSKGWLLSSGRLLYIFMYALVYTYIHIPSVTRRRALYAIRSPSRNP